MNGHLKSWTSCSASFLWTVCKNKYKGVQALLFKSIQFQVFFASFECHCKKKLWTLPYERCAVRVNLESTMSVKAKGSKTERQGQQALFWTFVELFWHIFTISLFYSNYFCLLMTFLRKVFYKEAISVQLSNCEVACLSTSRFRLKEYKDMFIFEFCSLMNLGMYIISNLLISQIFLPCAQPTSNRWGLMVR